jgi:hypothetical protein
MRRLDCDGVALCYEEAGEGSSLVTTRLVFSVSPLSNTACIRRLSTAIATGDGAVGHRSNG